MRCNRLPLSLLGLALLLAFLQPALADETLGKFKNVLADAETFVVTANDQDHTFRVAANAKILIDDREAGLRDLRTGDVVTVTWQDRDGRKTASMIVCRRR